MSEINWFKEKAWRIKDSFGKVDVSMYDYENGEATFTSNTLDYIREWGEKNKDRITVNYSRIK